MAASGGGAASGAAARVSATYTAPTNIAVIKYWGKRDVKLNLPINSSVSVTLSQDDLRTKTTAVASTAFTEDRLWLNGREEDLAGSRRLQVVLREIRARAGTKVDPATGAVLVAKEDWPSYHVHIVSRNSFPTAAGLASSAAGYACLVAVLADVFGVTESYPGELTAIARQGSGSACRSLYGGFVRWEMGAKEDGSDSHAVQVADEAHWPELEIIICVVSDKKKDTGSTVGMTTSVETSELLKHRAAHVVAPRLAAIEDAYRARDFDTFGRITMQDSNQFHATCLDTYPPIFYMNDVSKRIIGLVHKINAEAGRVKAAYTFDAGPNAVIYTLKEHKLDVLACLLRHFPPADGVSLDTFVAKPGLGAEAAAHSVPAALDCSPEDASPGAVRHVYITKPGGGPRKLADEEALADLETGLPREDA